MNEGVSQPDNDTLISVLYVDDEPDLLTLGRYFLEHSGKIRITTEESPIEALKSSLIHHYDAIISDYQMPGMDGIAFLKVIREKYGDIPFILFTGRGREEVVIDAINYGADFYIQKGGEPTPLFAELAHKIYQAVKRRRSEQIIKESEKRLADIIDFLPDATFAIDRSGHIIAWNRAIEEMTGVPSSYMLGKGDFEYAIPFYGNRRPVLIDLVNGPVAPIEQWYSNVNRTGYSITAESDIPCPKENQMVTFIKACPLFNQAGEVTGAIESVRDITESRKNEEELGESEIKFRNVVEYSRDGIIIIDFSGNIFFVNPAGLLMVDEETEDAIVGKKNIMEYLHPDTRERVISDINQVAQGTDGYISQYKLITGKGREIWVESMGRRIPFNQSEAILVSLRDITERKKTEDALRESEEHFRALTEQSPDIIIRVDSEFRILYCNPRITDYTGVTVDRIIGTDSRKFLDNPESTATWIQAVSNVFGTGLPSREQIRTVRGSWFDLLLYPEFRSDQTVQAVTTSVRNITRIKQTDEEREQHYKDLFMQREFTRALLDNIPIPVQWKDTNRRYLGCNQALAKFLGISQDEIIGKTVNEIWKNYDEVQQINNYDEEIISKGVLPPYQTKLTDHTGKTHEVIITKNLFRDYLGNITGIVEVMQDVTGYNQLIRDLKNREELFRMIITQSSDIFIIITPQLEISFISPGVEKLSGFLTEEVQGSIRQYIHPEDFKRIESQIERIITDQVSSEVAEFRTLKRDGSYLLLEGVAVNCLDNPVIKGVLITARDITSKKKTERELTRTIRLFKIVLDSSMAYFALLDSSGNIYFSNNAFSVQAGFPDSHAPGRSITDFFPSEWKEKCTAILDEVVRTNTPSLHEFQIPEEGKNVTLSIIFFPIQEDEHILIGFLGLDVTERKVLLSRLDESLTQNEVLEKLVKERTEEVSNLLDLKDSLITAIAHELRTPLTPLTVLLPLLVEEEDYSKREEIIRIIEGNTARIANIVEQILHLATLGAMYAIEEVSEVHMLDRIENLLQVYTIAAKKKEITIITDIHPELVLITSPPHLISVLDNVISNAVKYSKQGGTIRIFAENNDCTIILHIRDDGMGMTREVLHRVFEPFFKADPSRHDRLSPGLGLSVTKRLVQAIGGNISIESDGPDRGTEVTLTFKKMSKITNKSDDV